MKNNRAMKIVSLISIAMILIVSIITLAISNKSYSASGAIDLWSIPNDGSWYKNNTYFSVSFAHLINYNNVYCIQKGQSFPRQGKYMEVKYFISISGETAKIYKADKLYPDSGKLVKECEGEYNNLLAAIVCEGEMSLGYGASDGDYNDSQIALYYYWNEWLSLSGANAYMSGSSSNSSIVNTVGQDRVNQIMERYKEYASKYLYNAKIYYMTPVFNSIQRILLVERGERTELNIDIPVEKKWLDGENKFNTRTEITVELLANGKETGKKLVLNQSNNWKGEFSDLDKRDSNGQEITYSIKEIDTPQGYTSSVTGSVKDGFVITNTLLTEVKVVKQWDDNDDLDEYRPSSLKVTLFANGVSTGKTVILNESNNWTATFEKLNKYDKQGNEINYTVQEESIDKYEKPEYNKAEDSKNGYITWTITNKHVPHYDGYIEISGKVWLDGEGGKGNDINGVYDDKDSVLEGIIVRLKYVDENGNHKLFNTNLPNIYETKTNSKGEYKIQVNYDNSQNVYKLYEDINVVNKKLKTAYVEFEYDGMKYTTVANADSGENTSKATENESTRNTFDNNHSVVTSETNPNNWTDKNITATTKTITSYESNDENRDVVVKYCNGNGTYIRTNPEGAWKEILSGTKDLACNSGSGHELRTYGITVQKIPNINLGLFEREQPDIAIFSDIKKVEVEMNNQKYTYLYGVRSDKYNPEDYDYIQTKFQNKNIHTYTYQRPVNPADIAYLREANKNAMEVYVTYEITVGNVSSTLTVVVDSIINDYDSNYQIKYGDGENSTERYHITHGTMDNNGNIQGTSLQENQISEVTNKNGYSEIVLSGLGIEVEKQSESKNKIYIRYKINQEKLPELFNENTPPLNNAVEILSYSTKYGKDTLYAEQRPESTPGNRAGKPYAGYDYDSHPGNAEIFINNEGRLEAKNLQDDTDIAPAFVLCKDKKPKILSGTVWEDTDSNTSDNERIGDGKKTGDEKTVANVKVEMYKVNDDGSISDEPATLYKINTSTGEINSIPAISYTNSDGYYSFGNEEGYSVVTDRYILKFEYGNGIDGSTASTINNVSISARDYKSTIISSETELYNMFKGTSNNEEWHLNISKGYSIAVDEIDKRLQTEDLQYNNFDDKINMTAYSKPFKMQVEFNPSKNSTVLEDGKTLKGGNEVLKNELNIFDFGIIERAREDIYVQKTVDYLKITLSNGQVLIEGNPTEDNLNYVKAVGYKQDINNGKEAREALEKQMLIEMDSELIQGAQLEVRYAINVVNNSEQDYDYYVDGQIKTEYYYFGTNNVDNSPIITSSVNYLVDYVDKDFVYTWENTDAWTKVTAEELSQSGKELINEKTVEALENEEYIAYATTQFSQLAPGETSQTQYATAKKLLTNKDENVYENHIEILSIDDKVARTMSGKDENGTPVTKQYKPGNYVPSTASRFVDDNISSNMPGRHEQDDDIAKIIITPPTGSTSEIIIYVIMAVIELMIVFIGVVYIKKKRLIK